MSSDVHSAFKVNIKKIVFLVAVLSPTALLAAPAIVTGNVNMRTGPSVKYQRITTLVAGVHVDAGPCQRNGWCKVRIGRFSGWASSRYVHFVSPYGAPQIIYPEIAPDFPVDIDVFWGTGRRRGWPYWREGRRGPAYPPYPPYYPGPIPPRPPLPQPVMPNPPIGEGVRPALPNPPIGQGAVPTQRGYNPYSD